MKSFFLLLSALAFNCNISIASDSILTDYSIFGKLISENTLVIPNLNHFRIIEPYIFVRIGETYGDHTILQTIDVNNFEIIWADTCACRYYALAFGTNKCIVTFQPGNEFIKSTKVYDFQTGLLFEKKDEGINIIPSPNCEYFCTQFNEYGTNRLMILDKQGEVLLSNPYGLKLGETMFLNDSVAAVINSDSISFFAVPSGNILSSIETPRGIIGGRRWESSNLGRQVAITVSRTTIFVDSSLEVAWVDTSRFYVHNLSFSPDDRYLAFYYGSRQGRYLSIVKTSSGETVWTEEILAANMVGGTPNSALRFTADYILLHDPQWSYFAEGKLDSLTQTFVFQIDGITGELAKRTVLPGINILLYGKNEFKSFTCNAKNRDKIIIRKWQSD